MTPIGAFIDPAAAAATRRAFRVNDALREQVLAIGGGQGQVLFHHERAWASITFSGARHTLRLAFDGPAEVAAGERIVEELAEHEFSISGQLVADASVVHVEHRLQGVPRLVLTAELLLLEDR